MKNLRVQIVVLLGMLCLVSSGEALIHSPTIYLEDPSCKPVRYEIPDEAGVRFVVIEGLHENRCQVQVSFVQEGKRVQYRCQLPPTQKVLHLNNDLKKTMGLCMPVSEPLADQFITALSAEEDGNQRSTVAELLGILRDEKAIPALIKSLQKDPDKSVRWFAADALGKFSDPRSFDALKIAAAKDADGGVRSIAAQASRAVQRKEVRPATEEEVQAAQDFFQQLLKSNASLEASIVEQGWDVHDLAEGPGSGSFLATKGPVTCSVSCTENSCRAGCKSTHLLSAEYPTW